MRSIKTSRSNHAVGEIYKSHAKLHLHDPENKYRWADERPWWLTPLQVVGFVATGVGLTLCLYYATVILFLL